MVRVLRSFRGISRSTRVTVGVAILLIGVGGCKTQEDASAAALQMASTSHALCDYYRALDHVLAATEDAYEAQNVLLSVPTMDLTETRGQIRLRAELANTVGEVASLFQRMTTSSAATDASAAAGKLNEEMASMKGLTANDGETKAVTVAVQAIVALVEEHKEVEAAKQVAILCHDLSVFFESERKAYDSINEAYLLTAKTVALELVKTKQVDASGVFVSSLQPFGLSPAIGRAQTKEAMEPYLTAQINADYKLRMEDATKATEALSAALKEMDARVNLVAHDKPMSLRQEPFSLAEVKSWVVEINK
jgi:hypothetical protein